MLTDNTCGRQGLSCNGMTMKMPCTLQPQCNFLRSGLHTPLLSLRAGRAPVAFKSQDAHLGAPPGFCFATVAIQPSILVTCMCAVVRANHCTRRHTCSCSCRSRCARRRRCASSHNRPRNRWEGDSQHGAIGGTTEDGPCLSDPPRHKKATCARICTFIRCLKRLSHSFTFVVNVWTR
jgi:hypothetical protein